MPSPTVPLLDTSLPPLAPVRRGKVRDLYDADGALVIVATDRISAFDYVLGSGIPDKGAVLTQLSAFWFGRTRDIVSNHVISLRVDAATFAGINLEDVDPSVCLKRLSAMVSPNPTEFVPVSPRAQ